MLIYTDGKHSGCIGRNEWCLALKMFLDKNISNNNNNNNNNINNKNSNNDILYVSKSLGQPYVVGCNKTRELMQSFWEIKLTYEMLESLIESRDSNEVEEGNWGFALFENKNFNQGSIYRQAAVGYLQVLLKNEGYEMIANVMNRMGIQSNKNQHEWVQYRENLKKNREILRIKNKQKRKQKLIDQRKQKLQNKNDKSYKTGIDLESL